MLFTIASTRIKYLKTNLTKGGERLRYTKNCKIMMKEIKDTNKCTDIRAHGLAD